MKTRATDAPMRCQIVAGWTHRILAGATLASALVTIFAQSATAQNGVDRKSDYSQMIHEGFVEARHDVMVSAMELGRVDSIDVQVGDRVHAGQLIGKLEDSLQKTAVEMAQLQSEMTGELDATAAESEIKRLRAEQLRQLAEDGMARPDELLRAETDYRIAVARHASAIEQSEQRKLELKRYQMQLKRREIRVPMDGVIAKLFHHPGEYITPADPAIVRLLAIDKLVAVFNVPVEDTPAMNVGREVRVLLHSSSQEIIARVTSVAPLIDGESGTVQVRVELDNPFGRILSGDRCTLELLGDGNPGDGSGRAKAFGSLSNAKPEGAKKR